MKSLYKPSGFLVITRSDGKYFKKYSSKSKFKFYTHKEPTYKKAVKSVKDFKKKGVHAKIYNNFLKLK
jgi:ribosomal protein L24E